MNYILLLDSERNERVSDQSLQLFLRRLLSQLLGEWATVVLHVLWSPDRPHLFHFNPSTIYQNILFHSSPIFWGFRTLQLIIMPLSLLSLKPAELFQSIFSELVYYWSHSYTSSSILYFVFSKHSNHPPQYSYLCYNCSFFTIYIYWSTFR